MSPPALARPMILAFDACACSRKDEKSAVLSGTSTLPSTLPPLAVDDRGGVALQRMAEGVVGGDEEPGVAALLDQRAAGAVGERIGVVGPVHARSGEQALPVRSDEAAPEIRKTLFFSCATSCTASATRRGRHVGDRIDAVARRTIGARCATPTSGLFWWSADDDLDRLAERPCRRNPRPPSAPPTTEPGAADIGIEATTCRSSTPILIGLSGICAAAGRRQQQAPRRTPPQPPESSHRVLLSSFASQTPEIFVQLVDLARRVGVGDHVDDAAVLDDVMPVGDGRGKAEILLDQQDGEALAPSACGSRAPICCTMTGARPSVGSSSSSRLRAGAQDAADRQHLLLAARQLGALAAPPLRRDWGRARRSRSTLMPPGAHHRRQQQVLLDRSRLAKMPRSSGQ